MPDLQVQQQVTEVSEVWHQGLSIRSWSYYPTAQFATQSMSFLDLPFEIRRYIYKLLLDYAMHEAGLWYSGVRGIKQNSHFEAIDTGIFRLCKITNLETIEVFYAAKSFQLVCPPDVRSWKSSVRSYGSLSLWTPLDNLLATAGPHNFSKIIRLSMPVQLLEKLVLTSIELQVATPRLQYLRILPDLSVTNLGAWTTLTWLTLLKCARITPFSHKYLNRLVEQDGEDALMTCDVQMLAADLRYKWRSNYQIATYQPNLINYANICKLCRGGIQEIDTEAELVWIERDMDEESSLWNLLFSPWRFRSVRRTIE